MTNTVIPEPLFSVFCTIYTIGIVLIVIGVELSKYLHGRHHCCHKFHTREMFFFCPFLYQTSTVITTHAIDFIYELIEIRMKTSITISDHQRWPFHLVHCPAHNTSSRIKFFHGESGCHFTSECVIFVMLFFPGFKRSFPEIAMHDDTKTVCMHEDVPPAHTLCFLFFFFSLCFFYGFIEFKALIILEIDPEHFQGHSKCRTS